MATFESQDPAYEQRVRKSFAGQPFMAMVGGALTRVAPGEVEVTLPFRADLTQQHGYLHGGVVTSIADVACGYAALSLMPPGVGVLSIEFKVNHLRPGVGERLVARARVLRPGRSVTVCLAEVFAVEGGDEKQVAAMLATMAVVRQRPGVVD